MGSYATVRAEFQVHRPPFRVCEESEGGMRESVAGGVSSRFLFVLYTWALVQTVWKIHALLWVEAK